MTDRRNSARGVSLVELAIVMLIFAGLITSVVYGARAVKNSKVKAFIIQTTQIKNAANMFRQHYGTWPGDFAEAAGATGRLRNCDAASRCENGNGDEIIASSNSGNCRLPAYDNLDQAFPCTNVTGGNETAQFWRHLIAAGMIDGIRMSNAANYRWGDGLPKVRMGGGLQVIYNGDRTNLYLRDFATNVSMTGHFFSYQRLPNLLHRSFNATGDGPIAPWDTRAIDAEIDDGAPLTGIMRSTGDWGCGNVLQPATKNVYENSEQMQCFFLYRFDT